MAKACPSPKPLLSSGWSLAAPVAEGLGPTSPCLLLGPAVSLEPPCPTCPPPPGLDPDSAPLPSPLLPHPGPWPPQDPDGGEGAFLVTWSCGTGPGWSLRWPGGRTRAAPPTASVGLPPLLLWPGRAGEGIVPHTVQPAPPYLHQLPDGTSSPGLGHHPSLPGSWVTRPGPWCLLPCGHSSPLRQGGEVAQWVLARCSVLGRSAGPLFFLCSPQVSAVSLRTSE